MEPTSRGEPECPLRWTCKSVNQLAGALQGQGFSICAMTVYTLLVELGYSLQRNRKTKEGQQHPDRHAYSRSPCPSADLPERRASQRRRSTLPSDAAAGFEPAPVGEVLGD